MNWRQLLVSLAITVFSALATNGTDIPIVEDVVVVAGANPEVAVVFWKPLENERISMYIVYYKSDSTDSSAEQSTEVINLANSAMVDDLKIRQHYTFTVSVGYLLLNGTTKIGPRSEITSNSNITTGLTLNPESSDDSDSGVVAIAFYGSMLVLSMVVNFLLLIMSTVLLRQLRVKYQTGSNSASVNDTIELKLIRHCQENEEPRKPAREHSPKDFNELYNGKCSPAKEAEVELDII